MTILIRLFLTYLVGLTLTLEAWACEPFPVSVQFSDIKTASATVSWQKIDPNHVYQVSWRPKGQLSWNTSPVLNPDNDHFILTNLKDGTEYDVQVRSKCIAEPAFSPYAQSSLGFKTGSRLCAEENPTPPNRFHLKSVNGKYAVVQWENISDAVGTHISYGLTNQPVSKWKESVLCKGEESFIIKDLKPNTSYLVRVRTLCTQCQSSNDSKKSRWTTTLLFKTTNDTTLAEPQQIVSGRVYDDHLQPIANAQVTVGAKKVQTDANGRYFSSFSWQERTMVKAEHPDFMTRTVGFYPTKADTVFCSVLMEKFKVTHTFNGKDAMLLGNTAFTVQLPENSIIDETTGQAYTGTVKACITSARPGDPLFGERMPGGDFLAINAQGQERVLYSYGFFSCELRGENDQKLNLAPGVKASVAFQIAEDQQTKALPTMPLWHFDEQASIWKEEGTATKQGNTYLGEVSHFSSWNCDWPGLRAWVEGYVHDCNENPVKGGIVNIDGVMATTDDKGYYRQWVPANYPYSLNISLNEIIHYELPPNLVSEQTYQVPPINYFSPLRGIGYINNNNITIYSYVVQNNVQTIEYSLDSVNWQTSSSFTIIQSNEVEFAYVRLFNSPCTSKIKLIKLENFQQSCGLSEFNEPYHLSPYTYLEEMVSLDNYLINLSTPNPSRGLGLLSSQMPLFIDFYNFFHCLNSLEILDNTNPMIGNSMWWLAISNLRYLQELSITGWVNEPMILDFGNMDNLVSFSYINSEISQIPSSIGSAKNLAKLVIQNNNQILELPSTIQYLTNLKALYVSSLSLRNGFWLDSIGLLKKLRVLDISLSLQINSIPPSIGKLKELESLILNLRSLKQLPPEIANLKDSLKELILRGCPISEEEKAKIRSWLPNTSITF